jgi:hypothetical protein
VPVRVQAPGAAFVTTVRDLSATGLSLASPAPVALGTTLRVEMFAPGQPWRGDVTVVRSEARPSRAGFDTWILGLRFEREQVAEDIERFRRSDAA